MDIGAAITRRQLTQRLTQRALAAKIGAHRVHLVHVEGGRRTPSLRALPRIAQALGTHLTDLVK
jgi:transcriptional regulator with XRE-family HTH domain